MRPLSCLLARLFLASWLFLTPFCAVAAGPVQPIVSPARPRPVSPWVNWNHHAGLIFSGDVLRVERVSGTPPQGVETVAITFHVERAYRGARSGQILTIREWAGLWVAQPRYRVGEKLLLFLYPPSRLGLTSPVSEVGGRFQVSHGRVTFSPAQRAWLVDEEIGGDSKGRDGIPLEEFLDRMRGAGDLR